ncbi:MAG TPA: biopolymer transporter ExbD [Verrucomicrobiae bacterium]|jgi:biopolymer transport protein ExbD|nr:biopolymer transporter ExbD [Verrucomicrobiae bacterium]
MAFSPVDPNQPDNIVAEINITPLTDIFLVLLIIFMITSSAIIESGGKVNLPAAARTETAPRGIAVTITPERDIFVNQKKVGQDDLEAALRDILSAGADKVVILRGDRNVPLGEAVWVMSVIKKAGASEIAIAAQAEAPGKPAARK